MEREDRFPELEDRRTGVQPISGEERAARRGRAARALADAGHDALLMEACGTLRWLTGVSWGRSERLFAFCLLADGEAFWLAPSFEEPDLRRVLAAAGAPGEVVTWTEHEYAYAPLADALVRRRVDRLALEPELRHGFVEELAQCFAGELVSGRSIVHDLRGCKDAHELELLRRANECTQAALCAVAERLAPGMTDHEIARLAVEAQTKQGLRDVWNLTAIGPDGAFPHGNASGRRLERGSVLLIDTGGDLHGYQSDNTRTWVFGAAPDAGFERAWHAVRDAQRRAFDALRPGARCSDADRAARAVFSAQGFGGGYERFGHRVGHGIGVDGHEAPFLDGGSDVVLRPGMTFSDEPGLYFPGEYGLRIEDIVCVTADGADHFGDWQAGPTSPAPA